MTAEGSAGLWLANQTITSETLALLPFKVLHRSFVLLRRSACFERAQIPSLPGLRILLPRIPGGLVLSLIVARTRKEER